MNKYTILIMLMFVALSASGCLKPQEITPASIPDTVLNRLKWEQVGEPEINNQLVNISEKMNVGVNIITTKFHAANSENKMNTQISDFNTGLGTNNAAEFIVVRIGLPAKVKLPSTFMDKIIEQQLSTTIANEQEQNIEITPENTTTLQVTKPDGTTANANVYSMNIGNLSFKVIVISWGSDGINTIAIAVYPAGSIKMDVPTSDGDMENIDILKFDETKVQDEILELIKNIR